MNVKVISQMIMMTPTKIKLNIPTLYQQLDNSSESEDVEIILITLILSVF